MTIVYVVSYLVLPLFGLSLATRRQTDIDSRAARIGFAFLAGALLLTIEATLLSAAGIRWSVPLLALPLLAASAVVFWRARDAAHPSTRVRAALSTRIAWIVTGLAVANFAAATLTTQAVSPDYVLFWGVKAMRFADLRGIDAGLLHWPFFSHGIPEYPPLIPVVEAWGVLCSGMMPWLAGAAMSAVWLLAAVPVIHWTLAKKGGRELAAAVTAFWTIALANSLIASGSGGNAEAMLLAYLSIAAAQIASGLEGRAERWIAAIALSGAIITKSEGLVSVVALLAGAAVAMILRRRFRAVGGLIPVALAPAMSLATWFLYQWRGGLHVGYKRYALSRVTVLHFENFGTIAKGMLQGLSAGAWWIPWIVPALILLIGVVRRPRRLVDVLPLLLTIGVMFAFFAYVYLQEPYVVAMKISWTFPRITQPALSYLILAAAFASAGDSGSQAETGQPFA